MNTIAPIVLFAYNRLDNLKNTIDLLKLNFLANDSDLFIFVDGPKDINQIEKVQAVRNFILTITGFSSVHYRFSENNVGLSSSIISGVTEVINIYKKVIVIEDDLIITKNFLDWMNQALVFYQNDDRIISICGYGLKVIKPNNYNYDMYMHGRASSWGWATWSDRWEKIDWDILDWELFKNDKKSIKNFNKNGSDMFYMLKCSMNGKNSSWAIRFCYNQFKQNKYSVFPFLSKVNNNGFGIHATNCKGSYSRFKANMDVDQLREFNFGPLQINKKIEKGIFFYHTLHNRFYSLIRNKFKI